jgi:hypothetical protein
MALGIGTLWAVLAAMATSMVVGFIWYGPIWGKRYMALTGMNEMTEAEKAAAQKAAMPGYMSSLITVGIATVVIAFLFDWAYPSSPYNSPLIFGLALGTAGWLAFYMPGTFTNRFFLPDRPPMALWWITGIYWLIMAALSGFYVALFA